MWASIDIASPDVTDVYSPLSFDYYLLVITVSGANMSTTKSKIVITDATDSDFIALTILLYIGDTSIAMIPAKASGVRKGQKIMQIKYQQQEILY